MQKSEQKAIQFCQYFSHFSLPFPRLLRLLVQNLKGNNIGVPPSIFFTLKARHGADYNLQRLHHKTRQLKITQWTGVCSFEFIHKIKKTRCLFS